MLQRTICVRGGGEGPAGKGAISKKEKQRRGLKKKAVLGMEVAVSRQSS